MRQREDNAEKTAVTEFRDGGYRVAGIVLLLPRSVAGGGRRLLLCDCGEQVALRLAILQEVNGAAKL